ncbi:MAG: hypothetical protein OXM57_11345 [bacterium]|nr:hypothetical protein [bacterium]MDE0353272.1 hypothetical protein [bacterium]
MALALVLLSCAVAVLALLVFGLLRSHAEIIRALHRAGIPLEESGGHAGRPDAPVELRPPPDGAAHDIVGTSPGGNPIKISVTDARGLTLLAFLSSGCRTCETFWTAFAEADLDLSDARTRLVIVGQDPPLESETAFAALAPPGVKTVLSSAAWQDYDVPGSPYFALVDGTNNRMVGSGTAANWDQMRNMLRTALGDYLREIDPERGTTSGRDRARRADEALAAAGIGRDHPSVNPEPGTGDTDTRRNLPPEQ